MLAVFRWAGSSVIAPPATTSDLRGGVDVCVAGRVMTTRQNWFDMVWVFLSKRSLGSFVASETSGSHDDADVCVAGRRGLVSSVPAGYNKRQWPR